MYDPDQDPILWLVESCTYLSLLGVLQLLSGLATIKLIHTKFRTRTKAFSIISIVLFFAFIYRSIVDHTTHLPIVMVGGLSLMFTIPLHAIAMIYLSRKSGVPTSQETILRIAIPAALPSATHAAEHPGKQALRGITYLSVLIGVVAPAFLSTLPHGGIRLHLTAAVVMFTAAPGVLNISSAALGMLGARSPPPFRAPFISSSLSDFWGGRWNVAVSDALRVGVYTPLRGAGAPRAIAVFACFFVSGLAHEWLMLYSRKFGSGGLWLAFFTLQGVLVIAERALHNRLPPEGWRRWPLVAVALYVPFVTLFVPAAMDSGLAHDGVKAFSQCAGVARAVREQLVF